MIYCVECGLGNVKDARYCVNCGAKIVVLTSAEEKANTRPISREEKEEKIVTNLETENQDSELVSETESDRQTEDKDAVLKKDGETVSGTDGAFDEGEPSDRHAAAAASDADWPRAEQGEPFADARYSPPHTDGAYMAGSYPETPTPPPYSAKAGEEDSPNRKPLSTAAYFWLMVMYSIPAAGFLMAALLSFVPSNISLKRFSRAVLIFRMTLFILLLLGILSAAVIIHHRGWPWGEVNFHFGGWGRGPWVSWNRG